MIYQATELVLVLAVAVAEIGLSNVMDRDPSLSGARSHQDLSLAVDDGVS